MEEETKDVNAEESVDSGSDVVDSSTTDADESADSDNSDGGENRIPHSRVKEMEQKAYERGRSEAMAKLMAEDKNESPEEKLTKSDEPTDDKSEAMKILREAIRKEVSPLIVRNEVKEFLQENPDAIKYVDGIKDIRRKSPSLSWEQAYKLASFDDKLKAAETKGVDRGLGNVKAKEGAMTEKPVAGKQPQKQDIAAKISDKSTSIDDAQQMLVKQLLNRG